MENDDKNESEALASTMDDPLAIPTEDINDAPKRTLRSRSAPSKVPVAKQIMLKVEDEQTLLWTDVEKINLLENLYKHGYDSRHTYACLPQKTEEQIKSFLRTRQRVSRARKQLRINEAAEQKLRRECWGTDQEVVTPLEEWIKYFFARKEYTECETEVSRSLTLQLLPMTFFILSLFEAHPDPQDCKGINYREVYEFLYASSRGNPTKMLSKATANFLFTAFYDASKFYKMAAIPNESYYLNAMSSSIASDEADQSVKEKPLKYRTYPGKRKHPVTLGREEVLKKTPGFVSKLMKTQAFNPFQIPIDYLEFPMRNVPVKKPKSRQQASAVKTLQESLAKTGEPFCQSMSHC